LNLADPVIKALETLGYETPSPIQARTIPLLLDGRDVVGLAQTGTGKTAAFALPALSKLADANKKYSAPQALVLAPTRELACKFPKPLVLMQNTCRLPQWFPYMVDLLTGRSWRGCVVGLPLWWEPPDVLLIT